MKQQPRALRRDCEFQFADTSIDDAFLLRAVASF